MKAAAGITRTHNPFGEVLRASCLRENLTSSSYGEGLETGQHRYRASPLPDKICFLILNPEVFLLCKLIFVLRTG